MRSLSADPALRFSKGFNTQAALRTLGQSALVALVVGAVFASGGRIVRAQHSHSPSDTSRSSPGARQEALLKAPGHSIFGVMQEVIRELESRSDTDWSNVNLERLRQHLLDMHRVAQEVAVERTEAIENGVRLTVRPATDAARASLRRVLSAHPAMLKAEAGWSMETTSTEDGFIISTTDPDEGGDAEKIRALGYIGLLTYGAHHQHHHWMIVQGKHPHPSGASSPH